jgi:hypothetical protein
MSIISALAKLLSNELCNWEVLASYPKTQARDPCHSFSLTQADFMIPFSAVVPASGPSVREAVAGLHLTQRQPRGHIPAPPLDSPSSLQQQIYDQHQISYWVLAFPRHEPDFTSEAEPRLGGAWRCLRSGQPGRRC